MSDLARSLRSRLPQISAALVLVALAAAFFFTPLAPRGVWPAAWWITLLLLLAAAVGALHRPLGGDGLGVGLAAVALTAAHFGAAPAAVLALAASVLAELGRRRLTARLAEPPPERRGAVRLAADALAAAFAVLAAGIVWAFAAPPPPLAAVGLSATRAALGSALALVLATGAVGIGRAVPREASQVTRLRAVGPHLMLDGFAWLLGLALAVVADSAGLPFALGLAVAIALLSGEAARNARLHGLSEQRAQDLQRVGRAAERLTSGGRPMAAIADQFLVECRNILPFEWFELQLPGASGSSTTWSGPPDGPLEEGEGRAPAKAPPMLPGIHKRGSWEVLERELRIEGQSLATLKLWCDPRRVEIGSRQLLDELLPQMAASVYRALLDREAKLDALTGVAVRRVLEARLQAAYRAALDNGTGFAVVMCDLDHFKAINDTHGHGAGDAALKAVARVLDQGRRPQDLLARYGGEEFTLLIESADGATALRLADRLRRGVEEMGWTHEGKAITLTLSCGVAAFPELHIKTASELLLLADGALYEAKRQGRNLALHGLGHGHYRDPAGREIETAEKRRVEAPQIFV
jgi:diguanylate cyclase (GGDEF)-like protein